VNRNKQLGTAIVGKTRLALQIRAPLIHRVSTSYPQGKKLSEVTQAFGLDELKDRCSQAQLKSRLPEEVF
jgi:hypothetical protein